MYEFREIDVLTIDGCQTKIIVYHQKSDNSVKFGSTDACIESIKFAFGAVNVVNIIKLPIIERYDSLGAYSITYPATSLFGRKNMSKCIWAGFSKSGKPCFKSSFKITKAKEAGAGVNIVYPKKAICEMDTTKLKVFEDDESQK